MRKQLNPYLVRLVVLPSGERLPMLCRRFTGVPLFEPTVFCNYRAASTEQGVRHDSASSARRDGAVPGA